jgi:hypothetical protein
MLPLLLACSGPADTGDTAEVDLLPLGEAAPAIQGEAGDLAGSSVASADLDADGVPELVVGALGGRVACTLALPTGNTPLRGGACLSQEAPYDFLGQAVAAGDVDGDGGGDVLLGGPGSDAAASDAGRVWLVGGGSFAVANIADVAAAAWSGESAGDQAGARVAIGEDLDGDGVGELLVGAPGSDRGGAEGGALYLAQAGGGSLSDATAVYFGSAGDGSAAKHAENVLGDGVGNAACAADLDGDGVADLAIGVPGWDGGGDNAGAVAVAWGPVTPGAWAVSALDRVEGDHPAAYLGGALDCGGDLDGDGTPELLAGADGYGGGRAYVLEALSLDDAVVFAGATGEQAGYTVTFVDGGAAIGAPTAGDVAADAGSVALFLGGREPGVYTLADAEHRWIGDGAGDLAGVVAAPVGADALLVGAPYNQGAAAVAGAAYFLGW